MLKYKNIPLETKLESSIHCVVVLDTTDLDIDELEERVSEIFRWDASVWTELRSDTELDVCGNFTLNLKGVKHLEHVYEVLMQHPIPNTRVRIYVECGKVDNYSREIISLGEFLQHLEY